MRYIKLKFCFTVWTQTGVLIFGFGVVTVVLLLPSKDDHTPAGGCTMRRFIVLSTLSKYDENNPTYLPCALPMVLIALPCFPPDFREEGPPLGLDAGVRTKRRRVDCLPHVQEEPAKATFIKVIESPSGDLETPSSTGGAGIGSENGGYRATNWLRGEFPGNHERLGTNATRERTPLP